MQNLYILFGATIVSFLYYFFVQRRSNNPPSKKENPYLGLRRQAIEIKPEQIQLNLPPIEETAFGVVVDLGMGSGSATIVAFASGDASMYTSRGGGIIGGGVSRKNISASAIHLISVAQKYFPKLPKSYDLDIPPEAFVKFYILTNKNIYSFQERESDFTNPQSIWAELFMLPMMLLRN